MSDNLPTIPDKSAAKPSVTEQANDLWDNIKLAALIILGILFAVILVQNWDEVDLDMILWDGQVKLTVIMLACYLLGLGTGAAVWGWSKLRK